MSIINLVFIKRGLISGQSECNQSSFSCLAPWIASRGIIGPKIRARAASWYVGLEVKENGQIEILGSFTLA
ncbi:Uncharacterized protein TCM_011818 [Theobroma cacao]|uniref:Uncharacterized protein n=1 Tax=Theobroma cacao TaxID=3641 RepID=A0A061EAQ6_THECC|nr:Uncharacterized protein TCM_011818 [Theobroma cacao]